MIPLLPDPVWQELQLVLRLVLATSLGLLVGYEREQARKAAGLRTHGMVSLGSALFAVISLHGFGYLGDPARVAAQVVSGIGFLGAGAILQQRASVQGLTTAASLWATAAIGLAAGVGMVALPVATALLIFLILRLGIYLRMSEGEPGEIPKVE
jgi:putative Mg2+ transporter-C (MgtC) family protein